MLENMPKIPLGFLDIFYVRYYLCVCIQHLTNPENGSFKVSFLLEKNAKIAYKVSITCC